MILLLDNIPTPATTHRYNALNRVLDGQLMVWYQRYCEPNRSWRVVPQPQFPTVVLGQSWGATFWSLFGQLNRQKTQIDAVIIRGWNTFSYLYAVAWCRYYRVPLVLWSGSTSWERHWLRLPVAPIVRWVVGSASSYLAYGSRARAYLISLGADPAKVRIFWNSVDLAHFARARRLQPAAARQQLKLPSHKRIILFVGQLIERKNILSLVSAFNRVSRCYPQLHLVVAGVGPLTSQIEPSSNLTLLGHQEYRQLPLLYAAADVLILPSCEEVWGLVVNEAMAAGLPCAVSVTAGVAADLVIPGKTGWRLLPTPFGIELVLRQIAKASFRELKLLGNQAAKQVSLTDANVTARRLFTWQNQHKKRGE